MSDVRSEWLAPLKAEDMRAHFENSREMIFVVDAVSQKIVDANSAAAKRLGYNHRDLIGKAFSQVAPHFAGTPLSPPSTGHPAEPPRASPLGTDLVGTNGTTCPVEISISWAETNQKMRAMIIARETEPGTYGDTARGEGEERYRMLFNEMVSGFAIYEILCDATGTPCDYRYLAVNPAFEKLTGLRAPDIVGRTLYEVLGEPEEDWMEVFHEVSSTGTPVRIEKYSRIPDKTFDIAVFTPRAGQMAVIFTDVTERKQAEDALRKNEALFRSVIENMPASFFVKDLEGRYLYNNQKHLDWHRQTAANMIGKTIREVAPPEIAETYAELDRQVFETRQVSQREVDLVYPDGKRRTTIGIKFPIYGDDGEIFCFGGFGLDISDRKATEKALEESERRYRNLIESSPLPIVVHAEYQAIFINARAATMFGGQSPTDFEGISILDFVDPAYRQQAEKRAADFYEGRVDFSIEEFPLSRLDGTPFTAEVASQSIEFEGRPAVQIIVNDVTARKTAEQAARRLQDELAHVSRVSVMGEMAAGFAHELNQPLAAISNYSIGALRRLRSGGMTQADVERLLELMADQARRAGQIIRRIRGFLTKEQQPRQPVDLNDAIRETVGLLSGEALKHEVAIEMRLQERLPRVEGDVIQIQQLILNLARNGIEAMGESDREPRELVIETEALEDAARMSIMDCGPGLGATAVERLFDPFYTTKTGGMGMGLSICRSIVQDHHGTLRAYPREPHGAVFEVILPRESPEPTEK